MFKILFTKFINIKIIILINLKNMGQKNNTPKPANKEKMQKSLKQMVSYHEESKLNLDYQFNKQKQELIEKEEKEKEEKEKEEKEKKEGEEKKDNLDDNDDDFVFFEDKISSSSKIREKDKRKYPYSIVGVLTVKFPNSEDMMDYTCFLISKNIILTLATNLYDKDKGGKAIYIKTSLSDEVINWDNIIIQHNKKEKKYYDKKDEKNDIIDEKDLFKKMAIIILKNPKDEWFAVEFNKKDDCKYCRSIFLMDLKRDLENKIEEPIFGIIEIEVNNPFQNLLNKEENNNKDLIKRSPGSPIFWGGHDGGAHVVAILNQKYEFQCFDDENAEFLRYEKRRIERFKDGVDQDNIKTLILEDNDFGPLDMEYLSQFDLKYVTILNLSGNSIKALGAQYISKANFPYLKILNLNFNEIEDSGLESIASNEYNYLKELHLFYNKISDRGINYLVKAKFTTNLQILSLSDNPNIKAEGTNIMKENKVWSELKFLYMNSTGLNDEALKNLSEAVMPKLETLNIQDNNFSKRGKKLIEDLRKKNIIVKYKIEK